MMNLEILQKSYNNQCYTKILDNKRKIYKSKTEYKNKKNQFNVIYKAQILEIDKEILKEKVTRSELVKEKKKKYKNILIEKKALISESEEYAKLSNKEEFKLAHLILKRINNTYKKTIKEYDIAIKKQVDGAKDKKEEFIKEFESYLVEETKMLFEKRDEKIKENIEKKVAEINDITQKHNNKKQELDDFYLNNGDYITTTKAAKKANITALKKQKTQLIKELKAKNISIKNDIASAKTKYNEEKEHANGEIKNIKSEQHIYYSSLSKDKQKEYKELQKFVNQAERARVLKRFDTLEGNLFKKFNPAYIYITPAIFGALFFTVIPFIFMLVASLFKLDLATLQNSEFRGFYNFYMIFTQDSEFIKAIRNTLIYSLITVGLLTAITIGMAAWLAKNTRIHNLAQTMIFTPHIASLVAISILWIAMLNPSGIINQILAIFGIKGPGWLMQENTSLISVSFVTVWKDIGYYILLIISGLQAIPAYVYEAAKLDKAKSRTAFFKITLPLLAPTLSFVFVTKFINSFKVFAPIEIMTNGGPMGSSMVLSYWIYKVGRIGYNYGNAMAGAIVLTVIIAIFTFINYRFFNKKITY